MLKESGVRAVALEYSSVYVKYNQGLKRLRSELLIDRDEMPVVIWIYGETGTGKTRYTYEHFKGSIYITRSNLKWWDGYDQQKCILIDDFRKEQMVFKDLLQLLDRYPYSVETKGGHVPINSKFIVITAPRTPEIMFAGEGEDLTQLTRRITKIICSTDDSYKETLLNIYNDN